MGVHNTVSAGVCECSMALKFEDTCGYARGIAR